MVNCGGKWVIIMFMGEYHHSIDEKGRVVIPTKFRLELKDNFVIAKGLEKCLYIYSNDEWNKIVNKLNTLPFTKKDARTFIRTFFSGASSCELDKQGRINITSPLIEYAGLNHDLVIIGAMDRVEIWDKDSWNEYLNNNSEQLEDIAEGLFSTDI